MYSSVELDYATSGSEEGGQEGGADPPNSCRLIGSARGSRLRLPTRDTPSPSRTSRSIIQPKIISRGNDIPTVSASGKQCVAMAHDLSCKVTVDAKIS